MKKAIFLVLFSFISITNVNADNTSTDAALQCATLHNSMVRRYEAFEPEEKFTFVHGFLKIYSGEKIADDFMGKKEEFLSNMKASDSYAKLLILQWTESCLLRIPKEEKSS